MLLRGQLTLVPRPPLQRFSLPPVVLGIFFLGLNRETVLPLFRSAWCEVENQST